ncbi:MAG: hypothetical protein PHE06_14370 [Lachnospiraceae bacterium]|nr:hypothetical protein [Lachnospiraceae bacterium]MDD3797119.1 hypothetical protein [Lachnospiraceae bacterium]
MSAKTKILVMKKREVIYTLLFLALVILLVILLISMFTGKSSSKTVQTTQEETSAKPDTSSQYIAGIYTTPVTLGSSSVDVEVTVDKDHINSIRLVNLSEAATAMYPLVSPSLEDIAAQVCQTQSLENISCPEDNRYTSQMLLNAISKALETARTENWQ